MAEVQLLDIGEIEQEVFTSWDITGHQVTRHLLSRALTGPDGVVWDHAMFPPGFVHHMHRHPHADMPGAPGRRITRTCPCHPARELHQISNVGTVDSQVLHFFAGVGSVEEIGYEAYEGSGVATGSRGDRHGSSARG